MRDHDDHPQDDLPEQEHYDQYTQCPRCGNMVPPGVDYCDCGRKVTRDCTSSYDRGERDLVSAFGRPIGQRLREAAWYAHTD